MLCGGVAACHRCGVCTVRCAECVALSTAHSTHTGCVEDPRAAHI